MKVFVMFACVFVLMPINAIYSEELVKSNISEHPMQFMSDIEKIPLPLDVQKSMFNSCMSIGNGFSKEAKQFWQTLPIKLLSITPEFEFFDGKRTSIYINSSFTATSCPPLASMNGTFTSDNNGDSHKFKLWHGGGFFKYQIDDIFPPQYPRSFESPLKQFKVWSSIDSIQLKPEILTETIKCNEGLFLILKFDSHPACVKEQTIPKLIKRGWATIYSDTYGTKSVFEVVKNDTIFDVEYKIQGGLVKDMVYINDSFSLLVTLDSAGEGMLTLDLPRDLIDTELDSCLPIETNPYDDRFLVLLDGAEISYDELLVTPEKRTLQIQFSEDVTNIEIAPICLI